MTTTTMTMPKGRFTDIGRLRVHYHRAGPESGSGPVLVLLHGWPEFAGAWKKVLPVLADRYDTIAPDLRGFGQTQALTEDGRAPADAAAFADDLKLFIDALGIDKIGIVAHDVGGAVAQAFARAHPGRVFGLFLFNGMYPGIGKRLGAAEHLPETWYQYFHRLDMAEELVGYNRDTVRIYIRHFLKHWAKDPTAFDSEIEAWTDNFMRPGNLIGGFNWYRATADVRMQMIRDGAPKMEKITTPTRVLWGRDDPVLKSAWVEGLEDYFADVEIDVADGVGHFVHFEAPDLANREILKFFGRVTK